MSGNRTAAHDPSVARYYRATSAPETGRDMK